MVSRKKKAREAKASAAESPASAVEREESEGLADDTEVTAIQEPEQESPAPTPEQIIEALATELQELEDRHLRLAAEYDNFRKRTVREQALRETRAQAEMVRQLLESLDDLSRVSELGSTDHDAAAILEGVRLVEVKLLRALEQMGLKPIEAVGQPFDPELHEAMVTVATDEPQENELVSQELAKGYLFKDSLLRPALVEVKLYRPESAGSDDDSGESESKGGS